MHVRLFVCLPASLVCKFVFVLAGLFVGWLVSLFELLLSVDMLCVCWLACLLVCCACVYVCLLACLLVCLFVRCLCLLVCLSALFVCMRVRLFV